MVSVILDNLAAGADAREIADEYPGVGAAEISAALAYAADLAREQIVSYAG